MTTLSGKRILLVVSGGIAAFKALELIRLLTARGCAVSCVLTRDGQAVGVAIEDGTEFRAPVVVSALDARHTFLELLDPRTLPAEMTRNNQAAVAEEIIGTFSAGLSRWMCPVASMDRPGRCVGSRLRRR